MDQAMRDEAIGKLLLRMSPPVMLALLIQSIYNIVDSYFVGKYSGDGLTALSIIFPIQLLITALATGTGAGINILISRMDGTGRRETQEDVVKSGLVLGIFNYLVFACIGLLSIKGYYILSSDNEAVRTFGIQYGSVIFLGGLGQFVEANCTKMLQAKGNMMTPMAAQITGAVINVVLDPILIFGLFGLPQFGIAGAAIATIIGQWAAMAITFFSLRKYYAMKGHVRLKECLHIYKAGAPSMVMQSLYTFYIVGLNLILKLFTEDAVTVLGIYYKLQTFFFIPLMGLEQVILPIVSFNYGAGEIGRAKLVLKYTTIFSCGVMLAATAVFWAVPAKLLGIFSESQSIIQIGCYALRVIGSSFLPLGITLIFTVYLQGMNLGRESMMLTILRQVILFVPLAWLFHYHGLKAVWMTFPVTEVIVAAACIWVYMKEERKSNTR